MDEWIVDTDCTCRSMYGQINKSMGREILMDGQIDRWMDGIDRYIDR